MSAAVPYPRDPMDIVTKAVILVLVVCILWLISTALGWNPIPARLLAPQ